MSSHEGASAPQLLPPVVLTIVALTALNLAIAYVLARGAGLRGIVLPDALVWALIAIGVVAAVAAVLGWRRFVDQARAARAASRPDPRATSVD